MGLSIHLQLVSAFYDLRIIELGSGMLPSPSGLFNATTALQRLLFTPTFTESLLYMNEILS